jgi:hypothetical protein
VRIRTGFIKGAIFGRDGAGSEGIYGFLIGGEYNAFRLASRSLCLAILFCLLVRQSPEFVSVEFCLEMRRGSRNSKIGGLCKGNKEGPCTKPTPIVSV